MLKPEEKKVFLSVAEAIWAFGKGREPDLPPTTILSVLDMLLPQVIEHDLRTTLTQARTQLVFHIRMAEIKAEIAAQTANLAKAEAGVLKPFDLNYLSKKIREKIGA